METKRELDLVVGRAATACCCEQCAWGVMLQLAIWLRQAGCPPWRPRRLDGEQLSEWVLPRAEASEGFLTPSGQGAMPDAGQCDITAPAM